MLGVSETDITPESPVVTVGFGRADELSRGVSRPLSAQTAVWRSGEAICCIVTLDHIGFSKEHAAGLRREIGGLLSVDLDKVMLCFSHTHSAPNDSVETGWYELVRRRLADCVRNAMSDMRPVRVGWGNAEGDIGVNRRSEGAPLDRRIGILKVADASDGSLRLLLLRLTAHANVLKADNYLISPDYFGRARDVLREKYGCPVMLTQGASGNVAPAYFSSAIDPPDACGGRSKRSASAPDDMARELLRAVGCGIGWLEAGETRGLTMYSKSIELFADVPDLARAEKIAEEAARFAGIDGTGWLAEVKRLNDAGVACQPDVTELQYFAVGGGCLCGAANELMCEFALRASRLVGSDFFYLGGYTNGCTGYFPTEEEFDLGGFEVYWSMLIYYVYYGRVFPLRKESAGALIRFAADNVPEHMRLQRNGER